MLRKHFLSCVEKNKLEPISQFRQRHAREETTKSFSMSFRPTGEIFLESEYPDAEVTILYFINLQWGGGCAGPSGMPCMHRASCRSSWP